MKKKKYVFISNIAAPYQVKFCYALQEYFDAEFWFYKYIDETRPEWWKVPLGDKCKIMKFSGRLPKLGYFSFGLFWNLIRFKPDIVVLGGFMKWHWFVIKVLKLFKKEVKVVVMTEPIRYVSHDDEESNELVNKNNSSKKLIFSNKLFKGVDLYLGMSEAAKDQLIQEFEFPESKVDLGRYPQDIDEYFEHPLRKKKVGEKLRLLFANRLVERYNPIFVLEVFHRLKKKYPNIELYMNSDGNLKSKCIEFIKQNHLNDVHFLYEIDSWNNMHLVYKNSDILILPALYSNGNMTIIESMASGMGLVLSNRINDIEQLSKDDENMYICDLNIDEFSRCLEKYIQNPEILILHGKLNRKVIESEKNASTAKRYFDLFQEHGII